MSPRQIEAFRAAMLTSSITDAARMLHVTQPAVTRLIKELEEVVGFPLFERRGGRIYATNEAHTLLEEVERYFIGLDQLAEGARRIREMRSQRLRMAGMPAVSLSVLPRLVTQFMREHPHVVPSVQVTDTPHVVQLVASGQIDLGLAMTPCLHPAIRHGAFVSTRCECILPRDHPLARHDHLNASLLKDAAFVSLGSQSSVELNTRVAFERAGVTRRVVIDAPLSSTARSFVDQGVGVALVDPFTAEEHALLGGIRRPFEPAIPFDFAVIFPRYREPSAIVRAFCDHLERSFGSATGKP